MGMTQEEYDEWLKARERHKRERTKGMRFFNAFQLSLLFCAYPFLLNWAHSSGFWGAGALFWVLCVAYFVQFVWTIWAYAELIEKVG